MDMKGRLKASVGQRQRWAKGGDGLKAKGGLLAITRPIPEVGVMKGRVS